MAGEEAEAAAAVDAAIASGAAAVAADEEEEAAAEAEEEAAERAGTSPEPVTNAVTPVERYRNLERADDGRLVPLSEEKQQYVMNDVAELLVHIGENNQLKGSDLVDELLAWYNEDDPVYVLAHTSKRLRGRVRAVLRMRGIELGTSSAIPVAFATLLERTPRTDPSFTTEPILNPSVPVINPPSVNAIARNPQDVKSSTKESPELPSKRTPQPPVATQSALPIPRVPTTHLPSTPASSSSGDYAKGSFSKLYTYTDSKFGGSTEESYTLWERTLYRNLVATGCSEQDLTSVIHLTLRGTALRRLHAILDNGGDEQNVQNILYDMRKTFASDAVAKKAHSEFLNLSFSSFRTGKAKDLSEVDAVNLFLTHAQGLQEQLGASYKPDAILRDRLMDAFGKASEKLSDVFVDHPPETTAELLQRVTSRASRDIAQDNFQSQSGASVYQAYGRRWTDYRVRRGSFRGRGRGGRGRRFTRGRGGGRSSREQRACWVCGRTDHFARERHSKEEIDKAFSQGQNIAAFCAILPSHIASAVMAAEMDCAEMTPDTHDGVEHEIDEHNQEYIDDDADDDAYAHMTSRPYAVDDQDDAYVNMMYMPRNEEEPIDVDVLNLCFTAQNEVEETVSNAYRSQLNNNDRQFLGAVVDTACIGSSIIGDDEYRRYCVATAHEYNIVRTPGRVNFGGTKTCQSSGQALIRIYIHSSNTVIDIDAHVVPGVRTPFLLSLDDMRKHRLDVHTLSETLHHNRSTQKLARTCGFLVIDWKYSLCMYTELELQKLHRALGHRSTANIWPTLKKARPLECTPAERIKLEEIERNCVPCQMTAAAPGHFHISEPSATAIFNRVVEADVMFIRRKPIMHMKCRGINVIAAGYCLNRGLDLWNFIRRHWVFKYGPMKTLKVDKGLDIAPILRGCKYYGIELEVIPTEAPWRIGSIERSHTVLKTTFERLRRDLHRDTSDEEVLDLAVFTIMQASVKGVSPFLALYGTTPRLPLLTQDNEYRTGEVTTTARFKAIFRARKQLEKFAIEDNIKQALKARPPFRGEQRPIAVGDQVLTFRRRGLKSSWEGPFRVISKTPADLTVHSEKGNAMTLEISQCKKFRDVSKQLATGEESQLSEFKKVHSSVEPPLISESRRSPRLEQSNAPIGPPSDAEPRRSPRLRPAQVFATKTSEGVEIFVPTDDDYSSMTAATQIVTPEPGGISEHELRFQDSRIRELNGIMAAGVFKLAKRSDVPKGQRVFGTRFVDSIKNFEQPGKEYEKSRLVIQCFRDEDKNAIVTRSPSVSRTSMRILLSLAISHNFSGRARDVQQAYILSDQDMQRLMYCEIPGEMGMDEEWVWVIVKPIYGVPEAGTYWNGTYDQHHMDLGFKKTSLDPCLYFYPGNQGLKALLAMLVDDTLLFADPEISRKEQDAASRFPNRVTKNLSESCPITFNGLLVEWKDGNIAISQGAKISEFKKITSWDQVLEMKARGLYVATSSRPDLLTRVQAIDSTDHSGTSVKRTNIMVDYAKQTADRSLKFVKLDISGLLRVIVFTDAAFNVTPDGRSQLGILCVLCDQHNRANVLHYSSKRSRRVTRSVFGAELFALSDGFDIGSAIARTLREILPDQVIEFWGIIDSRTVFNSIVKSGTVTEKRLMIDVALLREAHLKYELQRLFWCPGKRNAADPMSKVITNAVFEKLLYENTLLFDPEGWTESMEEDQDEENPKTPEVTGDLAGEI